MNVVFCSVNDHISLFGPGGEQYFCGSWLVNLAS